MYCFYYYTSKIFIFYFLAMGQQCRRHKKIKNKVRYENSTIKLVLKSCQTFAKNYFMNLIFPKGQKWNFFMFPQNSHTILQLP